MIFKLNKADAEDFIDIFDLAYALVKQYKIVLAVGTGSLKYYRSKQLRLLRGNLRDRKFRMKIVIIGTPVMILQQFREALW